MGAIGVLLALYGSEEKEEERVEGDCPEEAIKEKYSRDDEAEISWKVQDLCLPLQVAQKGFYDFSQFGFVKSLIKDVNKLLRALQVNPLADRC